MYEHVISPNGLYGRIQNLVAPIVTWATEGCHWNRDTTSLIRTMPLDIEMEKRIQLRTVVLLRRCQSYG